MPFPTGTEGDRPTVHRVSAQLAEVDATRQQGGAVLTPREPPAQNAMVAIMSQGLLTVTLARGNLGHIVTTETTVGTGLAIDVLKKASRHIVSTEKAVGTDLAIDVLKTTSRQITRSDRDHPQGPEHASNATA